jgi:putative NIF3 family GTP cyclohydrolase 1 type 2
MTARQVMDLVGAHLDAAVPEDTVDRCLAGDPGREVHGVALTMLPTLAVLRRAAAQGLDLVICHEPLYYHHSEGWNGMLEAAADPVHAAKSAFVAERGLVVHRLHDALHAVRPDQVVVGTARTLGWLGLERSDEPGVFDVPATTLGTLAARVARALGAGALRYVGEPDLAVSVVGLQPGFWGFENNRATLARAEVDALVIGESHEWETGEYAADAVAAGLGKGLVVVGHMPSEQQGMAEVAGWLTGLLPGLPVVFLPADDLYQTLPA